MTLKVLENGELHFQYRNIDSIVDRTKIKGVRIHKSGISFFIRLSQKGQLCIFLNESIEEEIKNFILSCKENNKLKIPAIYVMMYLLIILLVGFFSMIKTTYHIETENQSFYELSQKYQFKGMLNDLCPMDLISYTPTSQAYYYYDKKYHVFPTNPPIKGLITFGFSEENYFSVKEKLQSTYPTSDWIRNYNGPTFYIHPKFLDGNSYGFIGYNKSESRIIFWGYEEGYISYSNPLESDFGEFVEQIYGRRYPGN